VPEKFNAGILNLSARSNHWHFYLLNTILSIADRLNGRSGGVDGEQYTKHATILGLKTL
jgi:hypothetical protein